jgi:hypothetical protein
MLGMPGRVVEGGVEVGRLDDVEAAEPFLRLGEGPSVTDALAVAHRDGRRPSTEPRAARR